MAQSFNDIAGAISYLDKASTPRFEEWLRQFLLDGDADPGHLETWYTTPETVVTNIYSSASSRSFQRKFRRIIAHSIDHWIKDTDPAGLLAALTTVAARLRVTESFPRILALAKEESLKPPIDSPSETLDVHFHLLRVLVGFQKELDVTVLFDRDLHDWRYAPLIFRASWSRGRSDWVTSARLLPILIDLHATNSRMDIVGAFSNYFRRIGFEWFKQLLHTFILAVGQDRYLPFLAYCDSSGIQIVPKSRHGFLVIWSLDSTVKADYVESPLVDRWGLSHVGEQDTAPSFITYLVSGSRSPNSRRGRLPRHRIGNVIRPALSALEVHLRRRVNPSIVYVPIYGIKTENPSFLPDLTTAEFDKYREDSRQWFHRSIRNCAEVGRNSLTRISHTLDSLIEAEGTQAS